jgi:hypothetical protein
MTKLYNKAKKMFRDTTHLVYFYLLNHKNVHFILLKMNNSSSKFY